MNSIIDTAGQETAIHCKHVTGDEAGAFRSQEDGSAHEFMQLAKAFHGCAQQKLAAAFSAIQQLSIEFRPKYARSNGVHADSMAGPFNG